MFLRKDLDALDDSQLNSCWVSDCYPGLHFTVYPQFAFNVPDSEEKIRVTRAPKLAGDEGLRFWLAAERAYGWMHPWQEIESYFPKYIRGAAFERISEEEFAASIQSVTAGLVVPLASICGPCSGRFVGALQMYSTKTDFIISLFAEYEHEFVHFHWDTTA